MAGDRALPPLAAESWRPGGAWDFFCSSPRARRHGGHCPPAPDLTLIASGSKFQDKDLIPSAHDQFLRFGCSLSENHRSCSENKHERNEDPGAGEQFHSEAAILLQSSCHCFSSNTGPVQVFTLAGLRASSRRFSCPSASESQILQKILVFFPVRTL